MNLVNVSRSPISCSSASSDRLYNAPRTIALNISTAPHGLRPAANLRSLAGLRHTVSSTGRKSSQGTSSSIIAKCLPLFDSSFRRRPSAAMSAKLNCTGAFVRAIVFTTPAFKRFVDHSTYNIAPSRTLVTSPPTPVSVTPLLRSARPWLESSPPAMVQAVDAMLVLRNFPERLKREKGAGTVAEMEDGLERIPDESVRRVMRQGIRLGQALLLRDQAARRFGKQTAPWLFYLVDDLSGRESIDRVTDALIECGTAAEFIERVQTENGKPPQTGCSQDVESHRPIGAASRKKIKGRMIWSYPPRQVQREAETMARGCRPIPAESG